MMDLKAEMRAMALEGMAYTPSEDGIEADWLEVAWGDPSYFEDGLDGRWHRRGRFGLWTFGGPNIRIWFYPDAVLAIGHWGGEVVVVESHEPNAAMNAALVGLRDTGDYEDVPEVTTETQGIG